MRLAVLYGGRSGEHEVSLVSAAFIVRHLSPAHEVLLIGVAKDGGWFLQEEAELVRIRGDAAAPLSITRDEKSRVHIVPGGGREGGLCVNGDPLPVDLVFPVLHGSYGEDGSVQGLLEMAGLPYAGCGIADSARCMDKEAAKQSLMQAGIPVVPFVSVSRHEKDAGISRAEKELGYPLFVKPARGGSSVGITPAADREGLCRALDAAFSWDDRVLIERAVPAREIECSVLGRRGSSTPIRSFPPGEISTDYDFYDYRAKYLDPEGARFCIPAAIDGELASRIRSLAERAYEVLDCQSLARVDFFIDKTDGSLYLNEINTMPGFTPISMFPKMCDAGGLCYEDLVSLLLTMGIERDRDRSLLKTDREG